MSKRARIAAVITAILAVAAVALAGCGGADGPQGAVEQAFLDFNNQTKTAKFTGKVSMDGEGLPGIEGDGVAIDFDMQMDGSDPQRPAFSMKMDVPVGDTGVEVVAVGDQMYMTVDGKSYVTDISKIRDQAAAFSFKDQLAMLRTISESVTNYKQSGTDSVDDVPLTVYSGDLDVGKLFEGLLPQLEKMMPSGAGGLTGGEQMTDMAVGMIKQMVKDPVQMRFGIDQQGVLRLIEFRLKFTAPFGAEGGDAPAMTVKGRFEAHAINEPVNIEVPNDAEPVEDMSKLMQDAGPTGNTGENPFN
jgi:hypothetical protein